MRRRWWPWRRRRYCPYCGCVSGWPITREQLAAHIAGRHQPAQPGQPARVVARVPMALVGA